MPLTAAEQTAVVPTTEASSARDVDTVPYVELINNRVQGVVSSGSDINRVYCAFVEAGTGAHYSSTNNNRPDAGTPKRIGWLVEEAVRQYGLERVVHYLQAPGDPAKMKRGSDIVYALLRSAARKQEPAGTVFSRFLNYLRFVELETELGPIPEMAWFVG